MITQAFEFHAPKQLSPVLELLDHHGERAQILAGGMSLLPMMNLGLVQPEIIISLNHLSELGQVRETGSAVTIGAMVRHAEIETDSRIREFFPLLSEAASLIGDVQVRHRGTMGGSVAHADPAADYLPVMMALDATFTLRSRYGERTVSAAEFFVDIMQTTREPSELLSEIQIAKPVGTTGSAYVRLARIEGAYAIASAAAVVDASSGSVRVAIGGVCPRPVLIQLPLEWDGGTVSRALLEQVGHAAYERCDGAMEDLNGAPEYRRSMARICAKRAVNTAVTRIREA